MCISLSADARSSDGVAAFEGHCATTFSGPLGLGASFNRTLWRQKGAVLGLETRAMNNIGWYRDAGGTVSERIGVTGFGPNINQPRDPRNGRLVCGVCGVWCVVCDV